MDVADALAALHQAGLVHGDVRPANIIVSSRGHAKVIDAGLARFTAGGMLRATAGSRLGSLPESAVATLRYLSPEEAAGERTDARSDVFSLGCVLHEMLAGQAPFNRPTADAIVLATLQASPPPANAQVASVPIDLSRICARALAKSMDRRYRSAAAMAEDLRGVASLLDEDLDAAPAVESPRRAAADASSSGSRCSPSPRWWHGGPGSRLRACSSRAAETRKTSPRRKPR